MPAGSNKLNALQLVRLPGEKIKNRLFSHVSINPFKQPGRELKTQSHRS